MNQKPTKKAVRGSWKNKLVASELADERAKCDFNKKEALDILWPAIQIAKINDASQKMDEHPELANTHKFYDMTRSEA